MTELQHCCLQRNLDAAGRICCPPTHLHKEEAIEGKREKESSAPRWAGRAGVLAGSLAQRQGPHQVEMDAERRRHKAVGNGGGSCR